MRKSDISPENTLKVNPLGRSYYCFCLEQAFLNITQARALVKGDPVDESHQLELISKLIVQALDAS